MLEIDIQRELRGVTLDLRLEVATEVVALFGPSGAGKSMTLKMIAGVERPDSGVIRANGRTLFDAAARIDEPPQRRRVGYVPQHYALFPHMTALENVALPLRKARRLGRDEARARASNLLTTVGLGGALAQRPGQLSGGQQQRVALARALATEPEILLLDEPFAALDAPIRAELRAEFSALRRGLGVPAIFVTHDLEEAAVLADRLVVMIDGRARQIGPPREVIERPRDRVVATLTQSRNILRGVLSRDGGLWARTAAGTLRANRADLPDGAAIDVIVRPDAIHLSTEDDPASHDASATRLAGVIVEVVDHGTRLVARVAAGEETLEVALAPSLARRLDPRPGQRTCLVIHPDDAHVVAALPDS